MSVFKSPTLSCSQLNLTLDFGQYASLYNRIPQTSCLWSQIPIPLFPAALKPTLIRLLFHHYIKVFLPRSPVTPCYLIQQLIFIIFLLDLSAVKHFLHPVSTTFSCSFSRHTGHSLVSFTRSSPSLLTFYCWLPRDQFLGVLYSILAPLILLCLMALNTIRIFIIHKWTPLAWISSLNSGLGYSATSGHLQ